MIKQIGGCLGTDPLGGLKELPEGLADKCLIAVLKQFTLRFRRDANANADAASLEPDDPQIARALELLGWACRQLAC